MLGCLQSEGELRIDCGSTEDIEWAGVQWSRDRFFDNAASHRAKREREEAFIDTELSGILTTNRVFSRYFASGYIVPLPAGRYGVTLHIGEPWFPHGGYRSFGIETEGVMVSEACDPGTQAPNRALRLSFEACVVDGFLNLTVIPKLSAPVLSAIEIRRTD